MTITLPSLPPPSGVIEPVSSPAATPSYEQLMLLDNGEVFLGIGGGTGPLASVYLGTTADAPLSGQYVGDNPVFTEDLLQYLGQGPSAASFDELAVLQAQGRGSFINPAFQGYATEVGAVLSADGLTSSTLADIGLLNPGVTGEPLLPQLPPSELAQYVAQLGTHAEQVGELTLTQNGSLFVGTGSGVDYLGSTGIVAQPVLNPGAPSFQDDFATFVNAALHGGYDPLAVGPLGNSYGGAILNALNLDGLDSVPSALAFEQSLIANPGPGQTGISDVGPAGPQGVPGPQGVQGVSGPAGPGITATQIATIEATVTQTVETYLLTLLPKGVHLSSATVTTAVTDATTAAVTPLAGTAVSATTSTTSPTTVGPSANDLQTEHTAIHAHHHWG